MGRNLFKYAAELFAHFRRQATYPLCFVGEFAQNVWSARPLLYQLRSDKTGTRGAMYDARQKAYSGADCEPAAAG
jgi:hypothetical protein